MGLGIGQSFLGEPERFYLRGETLNKPEKRKIGGQAPNDCEVQVQVTTEDNEKKGEARRRTRGAGHRAFESTLIIKEGNNHKRGRALKRHLAKRRKEGCGTNFLETSEEVGLKRGGAFVDTGRYLRGLIFGTYLEVYMAASQSLGAQRSFGSTCNQDGTNSSTVREALFQARRRLGIYAAPHDEWEKESCQSQSLYEPGHSREENTQERSQKTQYRQKQMPQAENRNILLTTTPTEDRASINSEKER